MAKSKHSEEFVKRAYDLFNEFYSETRAYREKCRENEEFWRANHWDGEPMRDRDEPRPVTPVLFSTLESMLSDIMDSYPEAVILGEDPSDDGVAEDVTQIVRFVLNRRQYRQTYRKKARMALKMGVSVQEVFWDDSLLSGLGDVNVRAWDIRQFCWDPRFEDIQEGRACFKFAFYPKDWFSLHYPGVELGTKKELYVREEGSRADDIMLLEYWWRETKDFVTRVHMAKFAGGICLEDSRDLRPEGMYSHGMYPFIVEPLFPLQGEAVGLGVIDIFKNLQLYADKMDQIIIKNALMSGKMKMLINKNADFDEEALTDWNTEVVRAGRIDDGAVRWMQAAPINPYVMTYQRQKLSAIKEESGQTMFSRGEVGGGITAASAILAMQEAGSKRSRMLIEQLHDGFSMLVRMVIGLIQENYTETRRFRILGEEREEVLLYKAGEPFDFDVSIQVQKQSPYRTLYQNELALQLLKSGIIDKAECIRMMSFEGKDRVLAGVLGELSQGIIGAK